MKNVSRVIVKNVESILDTARKKYLGQHCQSIFHGKCVGLKPSEYSQNWICRDCCSTIFPFHNIDNKKLESLAIQNYNLETVKKSISYIFCTICNRSAKLGIPCSNCKCLIHQKCSNIKNAKKNFHLFRGKWECNDCMQKKFPFQCVENFILSELSFSSITYNTISFSSKYPIDEKLKAMLNYSQKTPWHSYCNPDSKSQSEDNGANIHTNFDYYEVKNFCKLKDSVSAKSFSIFHTNISSLQGNIEDLEDLLIAMNHKFDIIALTETWDSEKSKTEFKAKDLIGYHEYYGTKGSRFTLAM